MQESLKIFHRLTDTRNLITGWVSSHSKVLIRIAAVLGALMGSAVIGLAVSKIDLILAIAAALPIMVLLLEYTLNHFEIMPVVILLFATFMTISLPTGTESRLVFSLVATIGFFGLWVLKMVVEKRFWLHPFKINLPILAFMAMTVFSFIWSTAFRDPLVSVWQSFVFVQLASMAVIVMLPAALLMVANFINDIKTVKIMVGIMIFAGAVGLAHYFYSTRIPVNARGLFSTWVVAFSIGLILFHRRLAWHWKIGLGLIAGLWIYWGFILHIDWVAGWFPLFVTLSVLVFMRSKKLFFVLMIIGILILAVNSEYYFGKVLQQESTESGVTRLAAWEANWRVTGKHLLFGTGPAGYAAYYMSYFPTDAMATHSNYLDILSQNGIVGIVLLLWFFAALSLTGYKLAIRLRGRGDFVESVVNASLAGTVACIVMMAFGDWLFPFAYTQTIAGFDYAVLNWLFMGFLLTFERITRNESIPEFAS